MPLRAAVLLLPPSGGCKGRLRDAYRKDVVRPSAEHDHSRSYGDAGGQVPGQIQGVDLSGELGVLGVLVFGSEATGRDHCGVAGGGPEYVLLGRISHRGSDIKSAAAIRCQGRHLEPTWVAFEAGCR